MIWGLVAVVVAAVLYGLFVVGVGRAIRRADESAGPLGRQ